ncbi:TPA: hypothetical protein GF208_17240 [Escherichia coli]|nr:hypothetical protein [Escherichia coli]
MSERLKTHSKTQKKSADLVSNKLRIGVFQRYQMKCKSVSKKSPRYMALLRLLKAEYVPVVGNQDNTGSVKRYSDNKEFEIKREWCRRRGR